MATLRYLDSVSSGINLEPISAGKLIYCIDTNELFYDVNDQLRSSITRFERVLTEIERLALTDIAEDKIYLVNETKHIYRYYSSNGWVLVYDSTEVNDIIGVFTDLTVATSVKNGKRYAPRTLARAVYTDSGESVENRLNLISKVGTAIEYVLATSNGQRIFDIPLPFENYFELGNTMMLYAGTVFIDPRRYSIVDNSVIFGENEGLAIGRTLTFIFIFNSAVNKCDTFTNIDGKYIANKTIPYTKLEKFSSSINLNDPSSVASSQAIKQVYDILNSKIDGSANLAVIHAVASGNGMSLQIISENYSLVDNSIIYLTMTNDILTGAGLSINGGEYIPIYKTFTQQVEAGDVLTGEEIALTYSATDNRFYITNGLPYMLETYTDMYIVQTDGESKFGVNIDFNNAIDKLNVYHNGIRLFENFNYTFENDFVVLKDYAAEKDDQIVFEVTRIIRTNIRDVISTDDKFMVSIVQSANQTIVVSVDGVDYTTNTAFPSGTVYSVRIIPNTGYTPGVLSTTGGVLNNSVTVTATAAASEMYTIDIMQTENQSIIVTYNGNDYTSSFKAAYGDTYSVMVVPFEGYVAGIPNIETGTVYSDRTIFASTATPENFAVNIVQSANQTIKVTHVESGNTFTESTNCEFGDIIRIDVEANEGYDPGIISISGKYDDLGDGTYMITGSINITVSTAPIESYVVTLNQASNQVITVINTSKGDQELKDGVNTVTRGDVLKVSLEANEGYNAGGIVLNGSYVESGSGNGFTLYTITGATTITADVAQAKSCALTITQRANQTITVIADNVEYTSSVSLPYWTVFRVNVKPNDGYESGTLSVTGNVINNGDGTYTLKGAAGVTTSSTSAHLQNITVIPVENQSIGITLNGYSTIYDESINNVPYDTKFTIDVVPAKGYAASDVIITGNAIETADGSYILKGDIGVTVAEAEIAEYAVTIVQSDNQTITVNCNGVDYTESFVASYGANYTATIKSIRGFVAGILSSISGTITSDIVISATEAIDNRVTATLVQSDNQTITVINTSDNDTILSEGDNTIVRGDVVKIKLTPKDGFGIGSINIDGSYTLGPKEGEYTYYTLNDSVIISASDAVSTLCTVTIVPTENQNISVVTASYPDEDRTSSFTTEYGDILTSIATDPYEGYIGGEVSITGSYVKTDAGYEIQGPVTISATEAKLKTYNITIKQSDNQTITVNYNGVDYTESFVATHGDTYMATLVANEGYNAGTLSVDSTGTITGEMIINATPATLKTYNVTIEQSDRQLITVHSNDVDYTESFVATHGDVYTARIEATTEGYNAGTLSSDSGTITSDITINATEATLKPCIVTINEDEHATIMVTKNDTALEYGDNTINYGDTLKIEYSIDEGYKSDGITITGDYLSRTDEESYIILVVSGDVVISASNVSKKEFEITITQSQNQTINVSCNGEIHTETFTALYEDVIKAEVIGDEGYDPGSINIIGGYEESDEGYIIKGNVSISASDATIKIHTVTVTQPENGTITVNNEVGTTFKFNHGTEVTIDATADEGYEIKNLIVEDGDDLNS